MVQIDEFIEEKFDELKFGAYFANLFARLRKMEEMKYSDPRLSDATLELANELNITNEGIDFKKVLQPFTIIEQAFAFT